MGYYIREGLVEENEAFLRRVKDALTRGRSLFLKMHDPRDLGKQQYRILRVFKATETLTNECEGDFADLGKHVRARIDSEQGGIWIEPKAVTAGATFINPTEDQVVKGLNEYEGDITVLSFEPSENFDLDAFAGTLDSMGWVLHRQTRKELEDGMVSYAVERKSEDSLGGSGFDILDDFGG